MKRAVRRHHYQRLKKLRKKKWKSWNWVIPDNLTGFYASTACKCSCWMCGNPSRNAGKKTRHEYRAMMKFNEGCLEHGFFTRIDYAMKDDIEDYDNGRYVIESVEEHIERVTN